MYADSRTKERAESDTHLPHKPALPDEGGDCHVRDKMCLACILIL